MEPSGWTSKKLGELGKCIAGLTYSPADVVDDGLLVLRSSNIQNGRLVFEDNVYVRNDIAGASRAEHGDILVCVRNGSKRLIGKTALVSGDCPESTHGAFMSMYRSSDYKFVFQLFQTDQYKRQVHRNLGATINSINGKDFLKFSFPYPPSNEREKITAILETWDSGIGVVEGLIRNSQRQKEALMQKLLTGKRRLPGYAKSDELQDTKYGAIPADWSFLQIGEIAGEVSERNEDGDDHPVLSCSKYEGFVNSLEYFKKKVYSDDTSNYKVIRDGDFGFPSNHIEEGSIGHQSLCDIGIVSPIYTIFRTNESMHDGYLYSLLKTEQYRQIFAANTNASVDRRGSLRWKEFSKIRVPVPPYDEQAAISAVIEEANAVRANYEGQKASLENQKKALMQQLLTGKRRVKGDKEAA